MKTRNGYAPYITGLGFAVIFGFSFLFTKNILGDMQVFQLLGIRFLIAALTFEALRLLKVVKFKPSFKMFGRLLPVAFFQPLLYFVFEVYGIRNAQSGEAGLMIGTIPVAVSILSFVILKEKINIRQAGAMVLSLSGIALISIMQMSGGAGSTKPIGYIFLGGAVVSAAFYNILSRKRSVDYKPEEITYVMMFMGAVVFNVIGIADSIASGYPYIAPLAKPGVILSLLYLGTLSSVLAFFFVNFTLSRISAVESSVFANLITVISIAAGCLFLKEAFPVYKIMGSVMIVTGVFLTNYYGEKSAGKKRRYPENMLK